MSRHIALRTCLTFALVLCSTPVTASAPELAGAVEYAGATFRVPATTSAFPNVSSPDPVVRWMIEQVNVDTLRQYDGDLSGEWPASVGTNSFTIRTRHTLNSTEIGNAVDYVAAHLSALGLTVERHQWASSRPPNVIGQTTGTASLPDIYMITAHLDDLPDGPNAPGADDNASGATAVLVVADLLSQFDWNCTLRFAFWTGEEQTMMGSGAYALRSKNAGENVAGVLNLDMIGFNTRGSSPDIDLYATTRLPVTIELANQMASVVAAYGLDLAPTVLSSGAPASDHASFWNNNFNAILGIEAYAPTHRDLNPKLHTTEDKLSNLDPAYFAEYVKAAVAETAHMAGCLVTGTLRGRVTANQDGSGIANAEIKVRDEAGREYRLQTGADGRYSQAVPAGRYTASISAYGYAPGSLDGTTLYADSWLSQDVVLAASGPEAATVTPELDAGEVRLTWPHVSPDTSYQVYRGSAPYFGVLTDARVATLGAYHAPAPGETLSYRDAESGAGDTSLNHFYVVTGVNVAGFGLPSNRTGEFDFDLVR